MSCLYPTTTVHWLKGVDPPDGYEDENVVWEDVAQVPAHIDFSTSSRRPAGGSVQWVQKVKFQCDTPRVPYDEHFRVKEDGGKTYNIVDLDYSTLLDCVSGTLSLVEGV